LAELKSLSHTHSLAIQYLSDPAYEFQHYFSLHKSFLNLALYYTAIVSSTDQQTTQINKEIVTTCYFLLAVTNYSAVEDYQCCDLETKVSWLESTRVHFSEVSVLVSRPGYQGLGLGLE